MIFRPTLSGFWIEVPVDLIGELKVLAQKLESVLANGVCSL
jgi:hypothetical protein